VLVALFARYGDAPSEPERPPAEMRVPEPALA
jgi:hypothetical protein